MTPEEIELEIKVWSEIKAVQQVALMIARLGNSPTAYAIERLLIDDGDSYEKASAASGHPVATLWRAEKRLKGWLLEDVKCPAATLPANEDRPITDRPTGQGVRARRDET